MIKRIRLRFEKMKIRRKMYLILIPVILLLILAFFISFQFILNDLEEMTIDKNEQLLSLICNDISSELEVMENTATIFLSNTYVKQFTKTNSGLAEKNALQAAMTRLTSLDFGIPSNSNIASFMIVKNKGNYVHGQISKSLSPHAQQLLVDYILDYFDNNSFATSIPLPDDLYNQIRGICYVLPLAENEEYHIGGYLVLIVDRGFLARIAATYYDNSRTVLVSDQTGNIIWGIDDGLMPDSSLLSCGQAIIRDSHNDEILFLSHYLDDVNWNVSIRVSMDSIRAQLQGYQILSYSMLLFIFVLAVFMITSLSKSFTHRLSEMATVIMNIQSGELDCRFPVRYNDEISLIGNEFNHMVDQLQNLHIKVAQQQLKQRESELHALQSQINPHFLYNSLDCIRSAALVSHDHIVAQQIQCLSNLFRYTVSTNLANETVTINAEVDHLYNYLSMLSFRFADRYDVDLRIERQILPLRTLKLVLQPVVENVFTHGIKHMSSGGFVRISGHLDTDMNCVIFCVEDNGCGIEPKQLENLKALLKSNNLTIRNERFMGLVNINDRIRLAYGNEYGVTVESEWKQGTKVLIKLPAIPTEGCDM